tara:strand:+ start:2298 stop:2645 length:348 start_codon:yes stop_codon:yes gene_type:complete
MLDRSAILKSDDLPKEVVNIPEWGGDVFVRTLTGTERDAFEQSMVQKKNKPNLNNVRARFAVLTVCDEKGERLFSDNDSEALGKKSASALDRVFAVSQRLNGFSDSDSEELSVKN